jgi:urease accessory protein
MNGIKRILYWATPALMLTALPAYAHPLHGDGLSGGLLHPLLGIDHLLAMVAVGVWAAQIGGSALWKVPLAFFCTLLLGAAVGLPAWLAGLLVGAFALFHGHAHISELPVGGTTLGYVMGFTLSTALLHSVGLMAGYILQRHTLDTVMRAGGVGLAGAGVWLLVGA